MCDAKYLDEASALARRIISVAQIDAQGIYERAEKAQKDAEEKLVRATDTELRAVAVMESVEQVFAEKQAFIAKRESDLDSRAGKYRIAEQQLAEARDAFDREMADIRKAMNRESAQLQRELGEVAALRNALESKIEEISEPVRGVA